MASYLEPLGPASAITFERYYLAADFISGIGYGTSPLSPFMSLTYPRRPGSPICHLHPLPVGPTESPAQKQVHARLHHPPVPHIDRHAGGPGTSHSAHVYRAQGLPRGPWSYLQASFSGTPTMMFMVWRCWVVWYSVSRRVAYTAAFLPALMLAASFASAILYALTIAHPNTPIAGVHTAAWFISSYTLVLSTNVLATGLILARLIIHRRVVRTTLATPHAGEYSSLISMLIESAALYSIAGVGYMITVGVDSPLGQPFLGAMMLMQQISGYLIVARLAHGRGWQTDTMSVPSKLVFLGHVSAKDEEAGDEEVLGTLEISGTA
ncbi:hypothetical protein BD779DRAFT_1518692 [Infundibulicybe gibba]|nr:hypothetical protein BD779DRAFT_1518692 [Infundibulicybe gibba]